VQRKEIELYGPARKLVFVAWRGQFDADYDIFGLQQLRLLRREEHSLLGDAIAIVTSVL
jgi:hypothetical protein